MDNNLRKFQQLASASVIHCLEGSQPSQIYFYLFLFFGTSRSIFLESSWNLNSKLQSNKQKILFYLCGHNIDISSRHTVVVAILALSLSVTTVVEFEGAE